MSAQISEAARRRRRAAALILGSGGVALALVAGSATASGPSTGAATVTDPGTAGTLTGVLASDKVFDVEVPSGAKCPGNSATGNYQIFSFMVPTGTDPSTLNFSTGTPDQGLGLFQASGGAYYGPINTGSAGEVPTSPHFAWAPTLGSSDVLTGGGPAWTAGIACIHTTDQVMSNDWTFDVTFAASAADPNGFTWTVPSQDGTTTTTVGGSTTSSSSTPTSTSTTSSTVPTTTTSSTSTTTTSTIPTTTTSSTSTTTSTTSSTIPTTTTSSLPATTSTTQPGSPHRPPHPPHPPHRGWRGWHGWHFRWSW